MRGADPWRYLEWLREETAPCGGSRAAGEALEDSLVHPRLLIVGGAGCGKTTFLRQLAHLWCLGVQEARTYTLLFPIFVRLSELRAETGGDWLIDFLEARSRERNWGLDREFFREKLGAALAMLDGLDEAPWAARRIEEIAAASPQSRFVVTARPIGPAGADGLAGFRTVNVGSVVPQLRGSVLI